MYNPPAFKLSANGHTATLEYLLDEDGFECVDAGWQWLQEENELIHISVSQLGKNLSEMSHDETLAVAARIGAGAAYFAFRENDLDIPLFWPSPLAFNLELPERISAFTLYDAVMTDHHLRDILETVNTFRPAQFDLSVTHPPLFLGAGCVRQMLEWQYIDDIASTN